MAKKNIFDIFEKQHTGSVINISAEKIEPNRYQPRLRFDEDALRELADSIRENGLIQPITVRETESGYEIIAGERRFRACRMAGMTQIPCYILSPSDEQAAEMALVENVQREDLTAIEEAKAYVQIMRQANLTQQEAAKKTGKSQSAVANKIRLLNLPQEVQDAVAERKITERHARALLALPPEKQTAAYHYAADRNLNVRQTEAYVEKLLGPQKVHKRQKTKGFTRNTKIGINSLNQCVQMIRRMGIDAVMETDETLTDVVVTVRFPK